MKKSSVSFVQTQDLYGNLSVPGSEIQKVPSLAGTLTLKPGHFFRNLLRSHRANRFNSGVVFPALKKVPALGVVLFNADGTFRAGFAARRR